MSALPIALTRGDVADYVGTLITIYLILIFIRILLSWIPRIPYNRILDMFLTFVKDVTDPWLNIFRRFIPPVRMGPAALDLSPMIAAIVLVILGGLLESVIRG